MALGGSSIASIARVTAAAAAAMTSDLAPLARAYPRRLADQELILEPIEGERCFAWIMAQTEFLEIVLVDGTRGDRAMRWWEAYSRRLSRLSSRGDGGVWRSPTTWEMSG